MGGSGYIAELKAQFAAARQRIVELEALASAWETEADIDPFAGIDPEDFAGEAEVVCMELDAKAKTLRQCAKELREAVGD